MSIDTNASTPPKRYRKWRGVRRSRKYSRESAGRVLDHIRSGKSLREITSLPGMPTMSTLDRWLHENREFLALYESARRFRCEVLADDIAAAAEAGETTNLSAKKFRFDVLKWDIEARVRANAGAGNEPARPRSPKRTGG